MKKRGRDDFSPATIKALERRVNARCSNPDCRVPTSGPASAADKANNLGVAAHIAAAAPGGPRYDEQSTSEQRSAIGNGIWLCANCATKIDRDAERYSVVLLNKWKKAAEDYADGELGKPPLSRQDHFALEGLAFGALKKNQVADAVSRISDLTVSAMEKLDPRFSIDIGYRSGVTSYTLNPRQPVDMAMKVESSFGAEFQRKYFDLLRHGKDLEIDAKAIRIEGSPLFDFTENCSEGKVVFSTHARKSAVLKCRLEAKDKTGFSQLDDIHGELVGGAESTTFTGKAFGGLIALTLTTFHTSTEIKNCSVTASADLIPWYGRQLRPLPYFNKVYEFYEAVRRGDKLVMHMEIDGAEIISARGSLDATNVENGELYSLLRYIRNVRGIIDRLALDVAFDEKFHVSVEDAEFVERIYQILFSQQNKTGKDVATATIGLGILPSASQAEIDHICTSPHAISFEQAYDTSLILFGRKIEKPKISMTYTMATLKKIGRAKRIEPGKEYKFRVCPSEGCQFIANFVN